MQRRSFLKKTAAGAAAAAVAAPAIAQSQPSIQWRMAASWPKSLDTLYGGAEMAARRVGEVTDGKFQIRTFAAGEIVPATQVLDAVQAGTVELGHTPPYYYFGKDPAFSFATSIPFGPTTRQNFAWWHFGGGAEAMAPLFKEYGCVAIACGATGCQMGGWFRKEIKTVADLKGLKFRIGYIHVQLLEAFFQTAVSEHAARMTAMDNAVSNCKEMVRSLTLIYTRPGRPPLPRNSWISWAASRP